MYEGTSAKKLDALCYIQEQVSTPTDQKDFGYQIHDRGNRFFLTFNAVLQSFDVKNRNGRCYSAENVMNCIQTDQEIQDRLSRNMWFGELDHPAPQLIGQTLTNQRLGTPDKRKSSHYIRKPWLEGNLLKAPIQTDSATADGMNKAISIVDGGIIPSYSTRVFGELKNINQRPLVWIKKLICYDWVGYPSHMEARAEITTSLTESVAQMEKYSPKIIFFKELAQMAAQSTEEAMWLCESFDLNMDDIIGVTETGNSVVIAENANIYVQPISDKIIRDKTRSILNDFITQ